MVCLCCGVELGEMRWSGPKRPEVREWFSNSEGPFLLALSNCGYERDKATEGMLKIGFGRWSNSNPLGTRKNRSRKDGSKTQATVEPALLTISEIPFVQITAPA